MPLEGRWSGEACGVPFSFDTRDVSLLDHGRRFETTSEGCEYVVALVERGAPASVLPDAPEPELHGSVPRSARIMADHLVAIERHLDVMDAVARSPAGRIGRPPA